MRVDVWSDVVCPWCFIGLANLGEALQRFEHEDDVEVVLHSFQLDPGAPRSYEDPLEERLAKKYGASVEQIRTQQERITALAAERGLEFHFEREHGGNTFDAHRLLHLARVRGRQIELKHRLGRAYFTDGDPIGEPDTLRRAAVEVGLDADEVEAVLAGDAFADEVRTDLDAARQIGIGGVPFFVIDGRLGMSGAQPAEALLDLLDQGWLTREPSPVTVVAEGEACGPDGCEI